MRMEFTTARAKGEALSVVYVLREEVMMLMLRTGRLKEEVLFIVVGTAVLRRR